jgi:hypothetical protein
MPPLVIPPLLTELIAAGRWPNTTDEERRQNVRPLVSADRVRAFAPEEETICLYCPPFRTVQERVAHNEKVWTSATAAPEQITFDKALVIGDFGLGSDAPILLDYRASATRPCVLRLRWQGRGDRNRWVEIAPDFDTFCAVLGPRGWTVVRTSPRVSGRRGTFELGGARSGGSGETAVLNVPGEQHRLSRSQPIVPRRA